MWLFPRLPTLLQITYGVADPPLNDGKIYPTLFRVTPDDRVRFAAIIKLLQLCGWNWVGILTSFDGSGDEEAKELSNMMGEHGICTEYIFMLNPDTFNDRKKQMMKESTAKVVILCGSSLINFFSLTGVLHFDIKKLTYIFPPSWIRFYNFDTIYGVPINCSFIFLWPREKNLNIEFYPDGVNFSNCPNDPILEDIGIYSYSCLSSNPDKNLYYNDSIQPAKHCTDLQDVSLPWSVYKNVPFYVYRAVYILAHALHGMYKKKNTSEQHGFRHRVRWIINVYITIIPSYII